MFEQYVLFAQNVVSGAYSDFIKDGIQIEGTEAMRVYDFINTRNTSDIENHTWKKLNVEQNHKNLFLSLYEDNLDNILIQSFFLDKDDLGRRVSYKFCIKKKTSKQLCQILKEASATIGRHPDPNDLKVIQSLFIPHLKHLKIIIISTIIILLISIIAILWITKSYL